MANESEAPIVELLARFLEDNRLLTNEQLAELERAYDYPWAPHTYQRIVTEQERRRKLKEEGEIIQRAYEIMARLVNAPSTLSAADLDELERVPRFYPAWAHSLAFEEREQRKAAIKSAFNTGGRGELVSIVRVDDGGFAIVPEHSSNWIYVVFDLDRVTAAHVTTTKPHEHHWCLTCSVRDCVHVKALTKYRDHGGGDDDK